MENILIYGVIALVILVLLFFIVRAVLKNKKPKYSIPNSSGVNIEQLVNYLGGKDNILYVTSSISKVTVEVKDSNSLELDAVKVLGATGVVQNQNKIIMIFGKVSEIIEFEIKQYTDKGV